MHVLTTVAIVLLILHLITVLFCWAVIVAWIVSNGSKRVTKKRFKENPLGMMSLIMVVIVITFIPVANLLFVTLMMNE